MNINIKLIVLALLFLQSCSSTTENSEVIGNRRQLLLVPSAQIIQLADESYAQVKAKAASSETLDKNPELVARLQNIVKKISKQTSIFRKDAANWNWEVHLIT